MKQQNIKYTFPAFTLLMLFTMRNPLFAQHDAYSKPVWETRSVNEADSVNLLHAFTRGTVHGHFRQFSMATINRDEYPDYYAIALGGGIRFQTASFHHFRFTLSGYFTYNLSSSDLGKTDEQSGAKNRYEIGLFDIQDAYNKNDIDRLEELNLSYTNKGLQITAGKQILNTPFINPQDGRMRPTEVSGIWSTYQTRKKHWTFQMGYINKISPRSTVKWFSAAASMGVYPMGLNTDGTPAAYQSNLKTAGIFLAGAAYRFSKHFSAQVFNQFTENIFNTALLQADGELSLRNSKLIAALQYIRQDAVNDGGNPDPSKTYFTKSASSNTISARAGWKNKQWQASANFTRIFKGGRFLMPREWGREPFFTFMQRERNEGFGDLTAFMLKASRKFTQQGISADVALGLYQLPDVTDYKHNKYGMPAYGQANLNLNYAFNGWFEGLQADLLYAWKWNAGNSLENPKYVVNKVNMSNINLILNYNF